MGRRTELDAFKRDNMLVDIIFAHKGINNAIGTKELARVLREKGCDVPADHIHVTVSRIVHERRLPICSVTHRGYYWATSKQDIQACIDSIEGKIRGLKERVDLLQSFICE